MIAMAYGAHIGTIHPPRVEDLSVYRFEGPHASELVQVGFRWA
jgi:hypothetical protein